MKKKELAYEYAKLFRGIGGTSNEIIKAVEVMKYMGRDYTAYLSCPLDILYAITARMEAENKK